MFCIMKSIELFAGAGGLGVGLHRAGFHPMNVRLCPVSLLQVQSDAYLSVHRTLGVGQTLSMSYCSANQFVPIKI